MLSVAGARGGHHAAASMGSGKRPQLSRAVPGVLFDDPSTAHRMELPDLRTTAPYRPTIWRG